MDFEPIDAEGYMHLTADEYQERRSFVLGLAKQPPADMSEEQMRSVTEELDRIEAEDARRAKVIEAEKRTAEGIVGGAGKKKEEANMGNEPIQARSLGEHFAKNMTVIREGNSVRAVAPAFRAATDPLMVPDMPGITTTIDKRLVAGPAPILGVRDLFGSEVIQGSAVTFYTEGALVVSDATNEPYGFATVNENGQKPQFSFDDPTPHTVPLVNIAGIIKETKQFLDFAPTVASTINGRGLNELHKKEEVYLVSELANTSGIQSDTTSWTASSTVTDLADLIYAKATDVENASGYSADTILMNRADWQTLRLGKDGSDRYYGGGYFADGQGKQLWGINVVTSPYVPAGTIYVGAFQTCASVATNGDGVSVRVFDQNENDAIYNRVMVRIEEYLALVVRRPAGFCKIVKA